MKDRQTDKAKQNESQTKTGEKREQQPALRRPGNRRQAGEGISMVGVRGEGGRYIRASGEGGGADRPHYTGPISASLPKGAKQEVATIPATLRGLPKEGAVRLRLSARQTPKWHPYGSHAAPSFDTMPEAWCGIRGLAEHWG